MTNIVLIAGHPEMKSFENEINIYFVMMFIMAFLAIEHVIPIAEQQSSYLALIYWLFLFGFGTFLQRKNKEREEN